MTIEQALNYLKSTGMSDEQIIEVADALTKGAISQLRAEIEQTAKDYDKIDNYWYAVGLWEAINIIDKYAESEDTDIV